MPTPLHQLEGYRLRLERELARALGARRISAELIERLVREVAAIDRRLHEQSPARAA